MSLKNIQWVQTHLSHSASRKKTLAITLYYTKQLRPVGKSKPGLFGHWVLKDVSMTTLVVPLLEASGRRTGGQVIPGVEGGVPTGPLTATMFMAGGTAKRRPRGRRLPAPHRWWPCLLRCAAPSDSRRQLPRRPPPPWAAAWCPRARLSTCCDFCNTPNALHCTRENLQGFLVNIGGRGMTDLPLGWKIYIFCANFWAINPCPFPIRNAARNMRNKNLLVWYIMKAIQVRITSAQIAAKKMDDKNIM